MAFKDDPVLRKGQMNVCDFGARLITLLTFRVVRYKFVQLCILRYVKV